MSEKSGFIFPPGVLVCPVCANDIVDQACHQCNSEFFELGEIPCVFTTGVQQKALWQHQLEMMETQGAGALERLDYILQGYDVSALSRSRLEQGRESMRESMETIFGLLKNGGLIAQADSRYEQTEVDDPTEYYQHILRDWAWDEVKSRHYQTHVNDATLKRVQNIWPNPTAKNMLVLGAGAGRLSWDLHQTLKPGYTIASDINPFLLSFAQALVKDRRTITLPELYTFPQIGFPHSKSWVVEPPDDPEQLHKSWFALGADVWNMPLKENSVNTIVTSWLLDVCSGDVKDLISVIDYLLEPGGVWVNTGPLLYSSHLGFDQKYTAEEILDFAQMAGFQIEKQSIEEVAHMASPINVRYHYEQVFSFSARKNSLESSLPLPGKTAEWLTPSWLIMHHQPVPKLDFQCQMGHDFIKDVLELVDGKRSIYLIAHLVESSLPEGVDAKDAVVALFGQILEQMSGG